MSKIKISDESIAAKKDIFLSTIEREKELAANGRISEIQLFLNKIKDLIETAIKNGLSYKQTARIIYATYNVKVSDQTVKRFSENTLGIKKERRIKKEVAKPQSTATPPTKKADTPEQKPAPMAEPKTESKLVQTDGVKHAPSDFDDI